MNCISKYQGIANELVRKSFSELRHHKIWVYESHSKRFDKYALADTIYMIFFSIIRIGTILREFPEKSIRGIIAHELCHVEIFKKRRFFDKLFSGLKYNLSKKAQISEEHKTEKLAIRKGYARELYQAKKVREGLRGPSPYHLSSKEIKTYAKEIGKW